MKSLCSPYRARGARRMAAWFISALALGVVASPLRAESETTGQDAVGMQAEILSVMIVDAEGQVIDLGLIAPGPAFSVVSDGSGDGEVATFLLKAPAQADVALTVIYDDLIREGTSDVVGIEEPDGAAICFRQEAGDGPCDVEIQDPEGGGLRRNDMKNGEGIAYVGYSVTVSPGTEPGVYTNDAAITLEAEALLGGQPGF